MARNYAAPPYNVRRGEQRPAYKGCKRLEESIRKLATLRQLESNLRRSDFLPSRLHDKGKHCAASHNAHSPRRVEIQKKAQTVAPRRPVGCASQEHLLAGPHIKGPIIFSAVRRLLQNASGLRPFRPPHRAPRASLCQQQLHSICQSIVDGDAHSWWSLLSKKGGGSRPIASGITLRRFASDGLLSA